MRRSGLCCAYWRRKAYKKESITTRSLSQTVARRLLSSVAWIPTWVPVSIDGTQSADNKQQVDLPITIVVKFPPMIVTVSTPWNILVVGAAGCGRCVGHGCLRLKNASSVWRNFIFVVGLGVLGFGPCHPDYIWIDARVYPGCGSPKSRTRGMLSISRERL